MLAGVQRCSCTSTRRAKCPLLPMFPCTRTFLSEHQERGHTLHSALRGTPLRQGGQGLGQAQAALCVGPEINQVHHTRLSGEPAASLQVGCMRRSGRQHPVTLLAWKGRGKACRARGAQLRCCATVPRGKAASRNGSSCPQNSCHHSQRCAGACHQQIQQVPVPLLAEHAAQLQQAVLHARVCCICRRQARSQALGCQLCSQPCGRGLLLGDPHPCRRQMQMGPKAAFERCIVVRVGEAGH